MLIHGNCPGSWLPCIQLFAGSLRTASFGGRFPPACLFMCCLQAGLLKCYGLDISSSDILQATLDGNDLPVSVVAEAGELNR